MVGPQVPKYQAIGAVLRQRILAGEYPPGSRLPSQDELATQFGVTLMTLRQAVAELESSGLVWAARGKGTFVTEKVADIRLGNLSSFASQMAAEGVELSTSVLGVDFGVPGDWPSAAKALVAAGGLARVTRLRSVDGVPLSLQRSHFDRSVASERDLAELGDRSLYELLEASTGSEVAQAQETITAVGLAGEDAVLLDAKEGQAAILSIRTSFNQFGMPFLYDEALLVGGRSTIVADRSSDRLSLRYGLA